MPRSGARSTTVRVTPETHDALKTMANQAGISMQELIQTLVDDAKAAAFLEGMNADFAALKAEPAAWAEEHTERAAWDGVLSDGLE